MKNQDRNWVLFWVYVVVTSVIVTTASSCASRKVQLDKLEIKKDSVIETKVTVTTIEAKEKTDSTNIITAADNSEITITPIDSSKTIIVDGKSYKNVVLKIKRNKVNTLYTNNKKESNNRRTDSTATVKANKTETTSIKNKTIDKKQNYLWINLLIILLLTIYIIWQNRQWLLKKLL